MTFDPQVSAALQALFDRLADDVPELADVMAQVRAGDLTEDEAMRMMMTLLGQNPDMTERVEQMAAETLAPLRPEPPAEQGEVPEGLFWPGVGMPQLHPLFEAGLVTRAQYDGDMPELRTGPLPKGVDPAVSVDTDARDPVALGRMLLDASKHVGKLVGTHEGERRKQIEAVAAGEETDLILRGTGGLQECREQADVALRGSAETDHPAYRRGSVPPTVPVVKPNGRALQALSPDQRREAAWKFLSTTQGRRSAIRIIRETVATHLQGQGYNVTEQEHDPRAKSPMEIVAHHEWNIDLGGQGATQASLAVIDMAAKAIAVQLTRKVAEVGKSRALVVEVTATHANDRRKVGWAGRLTSPHLPRIG